MNHPQPQQPPWYGYQPAPAPAPRNGFGTAGFVLGVIALVFSILPGIGLLTIPLAVLGVVFSLVGNDQVQKGTATNRGLTIAGLVTSLIAAAIALAWLAFVANAA